jgi:hypothetical protein
MIQSWIKPTCRGFVLYSTGWRIEQWRWDFRFTCLLHWNRSGGRRPTWTMSGKSIWCSDWATTVITLDLIYQTNIWWIGVSLYWISHAFPDRFTVVLTWSSPPGEFRFAVREKEAGSAARWGLGVGRRRKGWVRMEYVYDAVGELHRMATNMSRSDRRAIVLHGRLILED